MPALRLVPFGPDATAALRDAIVEAKGGDALAPVTVAVPSNYAGLSLRRTLGSGDLSLSDRAGLVNVRFLVLARVAELLGSPVLAAEGRRPLTPPVRAEAVRAALDDDPGVFADVAGHTATERSLEATFRELRQAPPRALDALAARSRRAADVVRLFRAFRDTTATYYDDDDLAEAAARAVRAGAGALRDVGHVVLHLPRRLSPAEGQLIEALAQRSALTAMVGTSGDAEADGPAQRLVEQLERALGAAAAAAAPAPPAATRIVAVTDAEEEVRAVLRMAMERLANGTPLHRMALLYPAAQPYALLAHEQFEAAGVPHNGPSVRTLAQTLSGRTLLGLLRLRDDDFRRDAVMDWLSAAPVLQQPNGRPAPAHRWDTMSRAAGVVRSASQWRERLARYRRTLEQERDGLERTDDGNQWRIERLARDVERVERLAAFIDELAHRADPGRRSTWAEFAAWARGLLDRYLGGEGHRGDWPDEEIEAHRAVEEALDALAALQELRPRTDESTFRRALERELDAPAGRIGRFGGGVLIGRVSDALGADFDVAFVVGMTEGLMPPRARDDPLLPDRERAGAGEELPLRTGRRAEQRRDYLAALASARERVLVFPRADLRGQRGKLPARWLLDAASTLEGQYLYSADLESLQRPWYEPVASFEAALSNGGARASAQEYDLHSLLGWSRTGRPVAQHYLLAEEPALGSGLAAEAARQNSRPTVWDGLVSNAAGLGPTAERAVSPTALQDWATCPLRYFLGRVLYVAETAKPEETLSLTPIERGNLIHRALERFIGEAPARTSPDQPWSDDERALLERIGADLCDAAEADGITGKALLWRLDRAHVLRDLRGFLDQDEALRAKHGVVPAEVELSFGVRDAKRPELAVDLGGGRRVAFRGRIDRVDRAPDGSKLLVIDYKTGSPGYTNVSKDPLDRGRLLQLPVYALAAQAAYGETPIAAYYWFVTERGDYELKGYDVTPARLDRFRAVVQTIAGGISAGMFVARPGKHSREGFENCAICAYDRVCPQSRDKLWERKRGAPELEAYVALAEADG